MFQLQLPSLLVDTFSKVGSMMGPLAMIVIGMLIGEMDLRSIFVEKRTYLISLFRLVVFPLIMILIFKFTGMSRLTVDADKILLNYNFSCICTTGCNDYTICTAL